MNTVGTDLAELRGVLTASSGRVVKRVERMFFAPASDWWKRVWWRLFGRREWTVRLACAGGIRVRGRYAEFADLHAVAEVFAARVYDLSVVREQPTVIVDAGAHIGCFSLLAARRFPGVPIEAFEPSASNHRLLEFNLRGNGVAQARAHHAALSNREGEARLAPASSMGGRVSDESGEVIRLVRLSRVVPMAPGARLLMKLDVEGSEWDVLEEATPVFPADTMLFVETHAGAADRGRIAEYARVNGFTVRHTNDKDGYDEWVLTRGAWGAPQGDAS